MKIIKPSIEIMRHGMETEISTPEQHIEKVGRTCYKSEDKITPTSAEKFVGGLVKRGHEAMIEHFSPIFRVEEGVYAEFLNDYEVMQHVVSVVNPKKYVRPFIRFSDVRTEEDSRYIVSGNMRAWRDYVKACVEEFGYIPKYLYGVVHKFSVFFPEFIEMIPDNYEDMMTQIAVSDLVGEFEHTMHHDITVKFTCDRGVSHEIVRHRTASFAQESTRYCNYGLGKFGGELTVIKPAKWIDIDESELIDNAAYGAWYLGCSNAEKYYFDMLNAGCSPQEARAVLPNSLKTEVIMTGNLDCWAHFFHLRCAPDAHPDIQVVAKMVRDEFIKMMPERYNG